MKTFQKLTRNFIEGYLFGSRWARAEFLNTFVNSILN